MCGISSTRGGRAPVWTALLLVLLVGLVPCLVCVGAANTDNEGYAMKPVRSANNSPARSVVAPRMGGSVTQDPLRVAPTAPPVTTNGPVPVTGGSGTGGSGGSKTGGSGNPPTTRPSVGSLTYGPSFLIGVWYQPIDSFGKWKQRGINTLVGYEGQGGLISRPAWTAAARAAGLFYILKPDPAYLAEDANDPYLLGWSQIDEPDGVGQTSPDVLIANYQAWKAVAPNKPVFLNFDGGQVKWRPATDYLAFTQGGDWLAFDYYACNYGSSNTISQIGKDVEILRKASNNTKPIMAFIECSDQNIRIQSWVVDTPVAPLMRAPTPKEMQREINVALYHGVKGIIYFPDRIGYNFESWDAVPPELLDVMISNNTKLGEKYPTNYPPDDSGSN